MPATCAGAKGVLTFSMQTAEVSKTDKLNKNKILNGDLIHAILGW